MANQKPNLYDLDLGGLEALLRDWGEPRYRAVPTRSGHGYIVIWRPNSHR